VPVLQVEGISHQGNTKKTGDGYVYQAGFHNQPGLPTIPLFHDLGKNLDLK
jgi:hypothetical protein